MDLKNVEKPENVITAEAPEVDGVTALPDKFRGFIDKVCPSL